MDQAIKLDSWVPRLNNKQLASRYENLYKWHTRFGHRDIRQMALILNLSCPRILPPCSICVATQMRENPNREPSSSAEVPLQMLHADIIQIPLSLSERQQIRSHYCR